MSHLIFETTLESVRKHPDIKLVATEIRRKRMKKTKEMTKEIFMISKTMLYGYRSFHCPCKNWKYLWRNRNRCWQKNWYFKLWGRKITITEKKLKSHSISEWWIRQKCYKTYFLGLRGKPYNYLTLFRMGREGAGAKRPPRYQTFPVTFCNFLDLLLTFLLHWSRPSAGPKLLNLNQLLPSNKVVFQVKSL